jgi:hypothetical protein
LETFLLVAAEITEDHVDTSPSDWSIRRQLDNLAAGRRRDNGCGGAPFASTRSPSAPFESMASPTGMTW